MRAHFFQKPYETYKVLSHFMMIISPYNILSPTVHKMWLCINLMNQTALLGDGAYRLEIISAPSLVKGLAYLVGTICSMDLQIL